MRRPQSQDLWSAVCQTSDGPQVADSTPAIRHLSFAGRQSSLVIFLIFLALYVATLLPDVLPADSGEFQRVLTTAGIAHPPGYPLYTMLGWLFTRLPLGATPAWRVSLFSAVTAAATVALVFSTARRLTGSLLGGLAAALTLGSATTFWATATKASIRPLTAFFMSLCLHELMRYASGPTPRGNRDTAPEQLPQASSTRPLTIFGLALSLGLTHHPSLVFPAIVFILYLAVADPALLRSPRRWLSPVAAFALGLSVFIYLPLRGPLQGAEDLATLSGFLNHVSARGFRGDMFALNLLDRLVLLPTLLRFQFNLVLLCGMLTGAVCLLWRDRKMALLLIGSFLVHTAVTLTYDAPQTVEYEMPAYVSMALLMAVPFGLIPGLRPQTRGTQHFWVHCVYPLCLAILLIAGAVNLASRSPSYGTLSRSPDAREYAAAVLREAPSGAVVLSNWHWFNPLRYLQQIEALRPDVTVEYVAPGAEPLAKTWVRRIDERIHQRPVIAVRYFEHAYSALPYRFEPLGEAFLVRRELRSEAPSKLIPLDITLGEQIELLGYQLVSNGSEPGRPLVMVLAWSPIIPPTSDIAIFTQLIGPDGRLWSAVEDPLHAPERLTVGEVVVDRLVIYPLLHASPGDYDLVVGAYSPRERFTTAEGSDAVRLERVRLHPSTTRPVTRHPCFARFVGGPTLIGTDYDIGLDGRVRVYLHWMGPGRAADLHLTGDDDAMLIRSRVPALERGQYATVTVDRPGIPTRLAVLGGEGPRRRNLLFGGALRLPRPRPAERYVPFGDAMVLTGFNGPSGKLDGGTEVTLRLRFCGQRPVERDYIVSTALTGLNADGTWAWRESHDTVPALGAVPTLKWIHASCILDPHHMTIPDDAPVVPTVGSLVVYDHFTQRTLPPLDERLEPAVELSLWNVPVP